MDGEQLTTEQIEALISKAVETAVGQFVPHFKSINDRLAGLETIANEPEPEPEPEPVKPEAKPKDKAEQSMAARLKVVEAQLKQAEEDKAKQAQEASSMRFDKTLADAISAHKGTLQPEVVAEILSARYKAGFTETETGWLNEKGQNVNQVVGEFMKTDAGKHFTTQTYKGGAGSPQMTRTTPPTKPQTRQDTVSLVKDSLFSNGY